MIFEAKRGQQANPDPALTIYGERLGRVDRYNYLGIVLDESLTFKSHIDKTISSCNHLLFSLAKIRWFINSSIAVQVYKSLILSRLTYVSVPLNSTGRDSRRYKIGGCEFASALTDIRQT